MNDKVNMKEIARLAGLSTMTVSRVFSNKSCSEQTKKKVEAIAAKLGFYPNMLGRSLVMNRLDTVGVVVPNIIHAFFPRVINAVEETLAKRGFNVFLCFSRDDAEVEAAKVRMLLGHRVAGIIMMPSLRSKLSASSAKMILNQKCPLVLVDRIIEGIKTDCVGWQSEEAMDEIVNHLLSQGYKKLAYVCGENEEWKNRGRTIGFFEALKKRGVKPFAYINCQNTVEDAFEKMQKLFSKKNRPDAVCCATDILVDHTLFALKRLNISIPDEVALTGFGGIINSHNSILKVTTVEQDAEKMGEVAADLILKKIAEADKHLPHKIQKIRLPMKVSICESSIKRPKKTK